MEELSIQEKASRYDEVVNKLKGFISQGVDPLITRNDVQDFFPELEESNDERIRKELIRETKGSEERLFETVTNDEFIAWMERQIKQKPQRMVSAEAKEALLPDSATVNDLYRKRWRPSWEELDALQYVLGHYSPGLTDKIAWDSIKTVELMYEKINKL